MKFLLVTTEYFPFKGGVANYYTNMIYHWPKSSEITVIDNNHNRLIRKNGFLKWLPAIKVVFKEVKKNKIDNILVGQILPLGTVVFILSFFLKIKYSIFFHGMDLSFCSKNIWKKFLSKMIINRSSKIICANSFVCEMLINIYNQDRSKLIIVNPGVNNFNFNNEQKKEELISKYNLSNKKILFSLGRLVKRKGFDYTILSLKKVFDSSPLFDEDLKYIIAGNGPDEEYLKKIAKNIFGDNFSEKIIFVGEISEEEKWTFLSLSDIFIMPARNVAGDFEGFGIVFLEASLLSKPVIAGKSGGITDAVADSISGLMVDPESEEEISQAILKLLNDPDLCNRLGENGKKRTLANFVWKNQVEKIYNFLK
ncbi:MAG TPA: glycosyltransferase family 4 protein [bacterium]|nr:glycosyltransferase family 4 protein [bacterium]HPV65261.1 glycosyltransferase family 4 protein [bacterium]